MEEPSLSDHNGELADKRRALQMRSARQRQQLSTAVGTIDNRLRGVDEGFGRVQRLVRQPAVVIGGLALGLILGPRRVLRFAAKGALAVSAARRLLRLVRR